MWKQKIGISLSREYPVAAAEAVAMLAACGFEAVSPVWQKPEPLQEIFAAAKAHGLMLQSLHAPFGKTVSLWHPNEHTEATVQTILKALDACREHGIPTLVMHAWIGFGDTFPEDAPDFSRFDAIVSHAENSGVQIAFENTEGEAYLHALMAHFEGCKAVGFCWDAGHEMCYNRSRDILGQYGDRLLMTHLNDNLGIRDFGGSITSTDDLHLLPYDGIADWKYNVVRLKKARKQEILNFELLRISKPGRHENDKYEAMPLEQYFAEAYSRACRIAQAYSKD